MKRTMNFILDEVSLVPELEGRNDLKMVLWAGDCVHEITDIERLPDFDVYLCLGFIQTLQANVDYMYNERSKPGVICIIDVSNKEQMVRFIDIFEDRFAVIDSDYNGNTPRLPLEYYNKLLSPVGKAFNIDGINGCVLPSENFQNSLELFAPVLSEKDNYFRTWTSEIVDIARVDGLSPSAVWTSPDFKGLYYDGIRARQEQLMVWNKNRNLISSQVSNFSKDTIEEYWSLLPLNILTVNFDRTNVYNESFRNYATLYKDRYKAYMVDQISKIINMPYMFLEYSKDASIYNIQSIYRLCKEYPGIQFAYMKDNRNGNYVYSHFIKKNSAL